MTYNCFNIYERVVQRYRIFFRGIVCMALTHSIWAKFVFFPDFGKKYKLFFSRKSLEATHTKKYWMSTKKCKKGKKLKLKNGNMATKRAGIKPPALFGDIFLPNQIEREFLKKWPEKRVWKFCDFIQKNGKRAGIKPPRFLGTFSYKIT